MIGDGFDISYYATDELDKDEILLNCFVLMIMMKMYEKAFFEMYQKIPLGKNMDRFEVSVIGLSSKRKPIWGGLQQHQN